VDYIALKDNGDIFAWRNGGFADTAAIWSDMGLVKTSNAWLKFLPKAHYDVQFVDINGDGKVAQLYVDFSRLT
jgi:hypothetical protein